MVVYAEREPGMNKYYLSQNVKSDTFSRNDIIANSVKKDDEVIVSVDNYGKYYILHGKNYVGKLSGASDIARQANANGIRTLRGFFVSDVSVWTLDDTIKSDQANGTKFADGWCPEARERGYIYIVQIAGFGTPV